MSGLIFLKCRELIQSCIGKTIAALDVGDYKRGPYSEDSGLFMRFTDGTTLFVWDDAYGGRNFNTEDALSAFVGAEFRGMGVRDVDDEMDDGNGEDEYRNCSFLIVSTSLGEFTIESYKWHNGYYGEIGLNGTDGAVEKL